MEEGRPRKDITGKTRPQNGPTDRLPAVGEIHSHEARLNAASTFATSRWPGINSKILEGPIKYIIYLEYHWVLVPSKGIMNVGYLIFIIYIFFECKVSQNQNKIIFLYLKILLKLYHLTLLWSRNSIKLFTFFVLLTCLFHSYNLPK